MMDVEILVLLALLSTHLLSFAVGWTLGRRFGSTAAPDGARPIAPFPR